MDETNWYSKKIGKNIDEFDMFDKYITDVLKEFVKEQKQAISVTRCCESDSELLKAVEKLKDFAYEVCPLHRQDDLEEIVGSL